MPSTSSCDLAIVGGGLAGALIALALAEKRPDLDVRIVEGADVIGGNHLWSFFAADIARADRWLVAPLVSYGWRGYEVAFPAFRRDFRMPYLSIESARLDKVVRERLPERALLLGRQVLDVAPRAVTLADGELIEAKGVIDARGAGQLSLFELGWQKFLGRELTLAAPHGQAQPIVMDATVAQHDGYRFVYALPFGRRRMFLEDTYYSDTPDLDPATLRERLDAYADAQGWAVKAVSREEAGALPVALGGDFEGYWQSGGAGVAKAGMRAGLFHPMTGYSLPDAVRLAVRIAGEGDLSGEALHEFTHDYATKTWAARGFYRMLVTLLFRAASPNERIYVLQRFYRLNPGLIGRFYAGRSTLLDKARVLMGKPPVPIARAVRVLRARA